MATKANIDDASAASRRWKRYAFTVPVRVTIEKPRHATLMNTRACQVNDGGIAMYTNAELSIGTQAAIQFTPAAFDFPLTLRGVVRNRAGGQYGVEFLVTSAAENEHLTIFREILHNKVGSPDA
jgi:hypothetical protein